jgi:CHAD domain-containing protein
VAFVYELPEDLAPGTLLTALEERFALESDGSADVDRTYLDTFDGLARGAGMTVWWEDGRLVAADGDGREIATAEWPQAPAALFAHDVPEGDLRDRLERAIDVRAATPIARVHVRRRTARILDAQQKTVVRLIVDEPSATVDHATSPLPARLCLIGLRGYDKALRRVRRVVEHDLMLAEAARTLADEAVLRAGGTPGGMPSRIQVELKPSQRADAAAVEILTRLLAVIEANLPGTLEDVDIEFLHDLRVAVRRTRSVQRELKRVFPPDDLARFRAEFKWLQAVTGPSRDLDVYLLEFDQFAATLPVEQRRDLEPLRKLLRNRRRLERRRMVTALRSQRTTRILAELREFLTRLLALPEDDRPHASRPISTVTGRRIAAVYGQMVGMGAAIDDDSPAVALHDLRKKAKELRYLLEFFGGLFAAETVGPMVKRLKALQDTLGRFQDREIQAEMLRSLATDIATAQDGATALMAMGVLVERLERQQAEARGEFAQSFRRFASKRSRAAVKETFR